MKLISIILFLFITTNISSQLNDTREKQLDSLVTNIDKAILRNLDSVHPYLHNAARTDRERAYLFFSLIAIHCKYDMKRFGQKKAPIYTNHFTLYSKSGVCRDFASLYQELCERSNIKCVIATGKIKLSTLTRIKNILLHWTFTDKHAWNIAYYENDWHVIDPTWSEVVREEKYHKTDRKGKRKLTAKAKRISTNYFDPEYEQIYNKRKCDQDAFYKSEVVYTKKSIYKKAKKRDVKRINFDYKAALDSMYNASYFNSKTDTTLHYHLNNDDVKTEFNFLKNVRTKFNPITRDLCDEHINQLEFKLKQTNQFNDYKIEFNQHKIAVMNYKFSLMKKEGINYKER